MNTLFLSDVVPYPPNLGRHQRVYHLLKGVSACSHVTFVCHTPSGAITPELKALQPFYRTAVPFPSGSLAYRRDATLPRPRRLLKALRGYLDLREPFLVSCTRSPDAVRLVSQLCRRQHFDLVWVERLISLSMLPEWLDARVVVDLDDVEHRRLAHRLRSGRLHWQVPLDALECLKLRRLERNLLRLPYEFAVCSTVDQEAIGGPPRVHVIPNGVSVPSVRPVPPGREPVFLFVGTMSLPPNADAACFFARRILPRIRRRIPEARFLVVGHEPPASVRSLHDGARTIVTGSVPDVEPYLRQCAVAVVPLRFGGGTRLKILEAMAHARPVVSTTVGAEGLDLEPGRHLLIADGAAGFADACVALAGDAAARETLTAAAYEAVVTRYDWRDIERRVQALVDGSRRPRVTLP